MSWFETAFGKKEERPTRGPIARMLYDGPMGDADKDVTDGIEKLMNFAVNQKSMTGGRAFSDVGDKMIFQMAGVTLGLRDSDKEIEAGDFEIEIRRVG